MYETNVEPVMRGPQADRVFPGEPVRLLGNGYSVEVALRPFGLAVVDFES